MAGNNHYKGCRCGFCIPIKKNPGWCSREDLENNIKSEDEGSHCRKCGRPIVVYYDKRNRGYAILDKLSPPVNHRCWERDDETFDLFHSPTPDQR